MTSPTLLNPMEQAGGQEYSKHYSFMNALDHIAITPTKLTLDQPKITRSQTAESIRKSLLVLSDLAESYQHKELPDLPPPTPVLEGSFARHARSPRAFTHHRVDNAHKKLQEVPQRAKTSAHIPRVSLGEAFDTQSFAKLSHLTYHHQKTLPRSSTEPGTVFLQHSRVSSNVKKRRSMKRTSLSRPTSTCSASGDLLLETRPNSAGTSASPRRRQRSITYSEQRCAPPSRDQTSPKGTLKVETPASRRRFRLVPSLKDLNLRSEKKRKTAEVQNSPAASTSPSPFSSSSKPRPTVSSNQMTLMEALRDGAPQPLSPLHDAVQDQMFTEDCRKGLALQPDPVKRTSLRTRCPNVSYGNAELVQDQSVSAEHKSESDSNGAPKHTRKASDTDSVSSSVLDCDWLAASDPGIQNSSSRTVNSGLPRPDSGLGVDLQTQLASHLQQSLLPPPASSLPSTSANHETHQPARKVTHPASEHRIKIEQPDNPATVTTQTNPWRLKATQDPKVERNSRLNAIAGMKGLHVELKNARHLNTTTWDFTGSPPVPKNPSPIRTRRQGSIRNARVDTLRRRHLHGNNKVVEPSQVVDEMPRRGSAPDFRETERASQKAQSQQHMRCTSGGPQKSLQSFAFEVSHDKSLQGYSNSTCGTEADTQPNTNENLVAASSPLNSPSVHLGSALTGKAYTPDGGENSPVMLRADTYFPTPKWNTPSDGSGTRKSSVASNFSRVHSRRTSSESQPSTAKSLLSSAKSFATDITDPCAPEEEEIPRFSQENSSAQCDVKGFEGGPVIVRPTLGPAFEPPNNQEGTNARNPVSLAVQPAKHTAPTPARPEDRGRISETLLESRKRDTLMKLAGVPSHSESNSKSREAQRRNTSAQIARLNLELERMQRVYSAMTRARESASPEQVAKKTYAELLEEDREAEALTQLRENGQATVRRTRPTMHKIEADLRETPPRVRAGAENCHRAVTITPSSTRPGSLDVQLSSPIAMEEDKYNSDYETLTSIASDETPPSRPKRSTPVALSLFPPIRTSPPQPIAESSPPATRSKRVSKRFSRSIVFDIDSHRKRYSNGAYYGMCVQRCPTPYHLPANAEAERVSATKQATPPRLPVADGRSVQFSALAAQSAISMDLNMDQYSLNASQIDRAIAVFVRNTP